MAKEGGQLASQHLKGLRVPSVENRGLGFKREKNFLKGEPHKLLQFYAGRRLARRSHPPRPTWVLGGQHMSCGCPVQ